MLRKVCTRESWCPSRELTMEGVFVCTAALAILDRLDVIDDDTLAWWLAERQLPDGGLNGRPEKLPDVCHFMHKYTYRQADQ